MSDDEYEWEDDEREEECDQCGETALCVYREGAGWCCPDCDDDRPIWERIPEIAAALPDEAIADIPADGASNLDHYLYGSPKKVAPSPEQQEVHDGK